MPTEIITDELYQIRNTMQEMVVRTFQFYLNDQNGDLVTFLDTDTWTLQVEVVNGIGKLGSNGINNCILKTDGSKIALFFRVHFWSMDCLDPVAS